MINETVKFETRSKREERQTLLFKKKAEKERKYWEQELNAKLWTAATTSFVLAGKWVRKDRFRKTRL